MSSNHIEDQLTDYVDGHLSGPTLAQVKSHLVFCTTCRQLYQDLLKQTALLKSTPLVEPPQELEKRILLSLSEKPIKEQTRPVEKGPTWIQWFLSFRGMSLAGAVVVLIFVLQNGPKMVEQSKPFSAHRSEQGETPLAKSLDQKTHEDSPLKEESLRAADATEQQSLAGSVEKQVAPSTYEKGELTRGSSARLAQNTAFHDLRKSISTPPQEDKKGPAFKGADASQKSDEEKAVNDIINIDGQVFAGFNSAITQPLEKIISDPKTWQDYWGRHQKNQTETAPLPVVDFEKNEVIAVFAGEQPTLGFRVEITRVLMTQWENAPARIVRYRVIGPSEGTVAGQALTQPYCLKIVPKFNGPTFFRKIR